MNNPNNNSEIASLAQALVARRRIPNATYRLQFNRAFTFRDALAIVPYLHDLGVSDIYASPIFKARAGSSHGYDICDHSQLNPDLGTLEDWNRLGEALREREMGLVLDVVPNHMGIGDARNAWWTDVLENGPSSIYAPYFDILWDPVKPELKNKVLLPILENTYGQVLESGKLRLAYEDGAFFIHYSETRLPVAPRTYSHILSHKLDALTQSLGEDHEHAQELQSILTALSYLPPRTERDPRRLAERNREKEIIKRRIDALYQASPTMRDALDATVQEFNGTVGDPHSFDRLDALLEDQAYRPAFWRVAAEEINYRRFFDINDLAAIRVEEPEVFEATHRLVLCWLTTGQITGLRIDHADGLWNPSEYLKQLQIAYLVAQIRAREKSDDASLNEQVAAWLEAHPNNLPLYVVAEKILSEDESLPSDWAVYGTTGYDFLNQVNGLFVDSRQRDAFDKIYADFIGAPIHFGNLVNTTKKMTMLVSLASEIYALSHQLERIAERNRWYRDFTLDTLTFTLREVIACLPIYRTYITRPDNISQRDQKFVELAVAEAKRRNPRTAQAIFDFVRDSLLLRNLQNFRAEDQAQLVGWVKKFQQITGPVMAKSVEDTAFYVFNRLVSLNEVGGSPDQFGSSVADFHEQNTERHRLLPHTMLASATHDTKRGEDVRARINVLSEMPDEWQAALARWRELNASKKTRVDGKPAPDANDEYLLYQTLIGAWPADSPSPEEFARLRERIAAYMQKATKEAKVHTSWINPNQEYDQAVREFIARILPDGNDAFLDDLRAFQRRVAFFGQFNSLSQTLLKLTSPGVPDIYQGTDLWDYSLVDPDNRRPVDFQRHRALLNDWRNSAASHTDRAALARQFLNTGVDGRIKLYVIHRTLDFRRAHPGLFTDGDYLPLEARGAKAEHVCAFARTRGEQCIIVAAPRLIVGLTNSKEQLPLGESVWQDTWLALPFEQSGGSYRDVFTGKTLALEERDGARGVALAQMLDEFPIALLQRVAKQDS